MKIRALALSATCLLTVATATALAPTSTAALTSAPPQGPFVEPLQRVDKLADDVVTNGRVRSVTTVDPAGREVVVQGSFTRIGRYSGPAVLVDPATGQRGGRFPVLDGSVSVSVPDGAGGWYVAGDFGEADGLRRPSVVRVTAAGEVDRRFTYPAPSDGDCCSRASVYALALAGDTLYVGGDGLDGYGSDGAPSVVRGLDATTGEPTGFGLTGNRPVNELLHVPADGDTPARLLLAAEGRLRAVDAATGVGVPGFTGHTDVRALALGDDAGTVFVGNDTVTAIDAATGSPVAGFTPPTLGAASQVETFLLDEGRLYAGGRLGSPGAWRGLVALDPETGAADTSFASTIAVGNDGFGVFDLDRLGGDLWAGGRFDRTTSRAAANLVALDPVTGTARPGPGLRLDRQVNAVDVSSGRLLVGGHFYMAGYTRAPGIATVGGAALGVITPGRVPLPFDGTLIGGGRFQVLTTRTNFPGYRAGARRPWSNRTDRVATIDTLTGRRVARGSLGEVSRLSGITVTGGRTAIAQRLSDAARFPRTRVTVRSTETGGLLERMVLPLRGYVTDLRLEGNWLYASGSFRRFENGRARHLAVVRVNLRTERMNHRFDPFVNGAVLDLSERAGRLYVAGDFSRALGSATQRRIASLRIQDGGVMPRFEGSGRFYPYQGRRSVIDLGDVVLLPTQGTYLDPVTGRRVDDPTDRFWPADVAVPTRDGFVHGATRWLDVAGRGDTIGVVGRTATR